MMNANNPNSSYKTTSSSLQTLIEKIEPVTVSIEGTSSHGTVVTTLD
ncbi:MAG: hypothetical protein WCK88_08225 [bacterium]